MRKLLLLVGLAGVFATCVWLISTRCNADEGTWYKSVNGYVYRSGNPVAYVDIIAKDSQHDWPTVAQTNGSGYYSWTPGSGWDHGTIQMRVRPNCDDYPPPDKKVYFGTTPSWGHDDDSSFSTQVDLVAGNCEESKK